MRKFPEDGSEPDCRFCKIMTCPTADALFIAEFELGIALLHPNQCYAGRAMYVARRHIIDFPHTGSSIFLDLTNEALSLCTAIDEALQPDLLNLALLGNKVRHFHYHIIPRYEKDDNWGEPPWPNHELLLNPSEYQRIVCRIRERIGHR